jgi:SEC-C motif domain protein
MPKTAISDAICPCSVRESDAQSYSQCCQRWHDAFEQGVFPATAQELMRSRYSAYALAKSNDALGHRMLQYLHDTWHVSTAPGEIELAPIQWTGLEVLQAEQSTDVAVVEFVAHFKENGRAQKMHEISRFVRVEGAWQYLDGDVSS